VPTAAISIVALPTQPVPECQGASAAALLGRWWVVQTQARNEKVVAAALERQQITHYLPLVRRLRIYAGRRVTVELPLFPGYVFLRGEGAECEAAWRTRRVSKILRVYDQARLQTELQHVRQVVDSDESTAVYPALVVGKRCRVTSGSLRGLEGVVVRRRRNCRLYIAVTILGQSAVVEIDGSLLETLD